MINAHELRIGNLVQINGKDYTFELDDFYYIKEDGVWHLDNFEPIPLTEDWLVKLGFMQWVEFGHKTGTFDLMPICGVSYDLVTKKVMILEKGNSMSHWIERKIEYIHQLQNLYFALTGEELEMKGGENE